jgi:glutamate mutase epsilon subunit
MFAKIVAKVFNKDNEEIAEVSTDEVVLKALCAYRDNLVMSDKSNFDQINPELILIGQAINDIVNNMKVSS